MVDTEAACVPGKKRDHPVWRFFKIVLGVIFLILGVVGLFLPVLQGVLFLLLALAILSTESRRVRRLRDGLRQRYPGPWEKAEAWKESLGAWWRSKREKGGKEHDR